jgi:hypothetical protein
MQMARDPVKETPDSAQMVALYKSVLQKVLDKRPSGTRQRVAAALGKNRSFVSQISNPAYSTPIPAAHVEQIMEICHFSPKEREAFIEAYALAHPRHQGLVDKGPKVRARTLFLPDLGDMERNRKLDALIDDFIRNLSDLVDDGGG